MSYRLGTNAMRVITRDDRGRVTKRVKYKKGDEVDTSGESFTDARIESLVASGDLVEGDADLPDGDGNAALADGDYDPNRVGEGVSPAQGGSDEGFDGDNHEGPLDQGEEASLQDEYTDMDYRDLQTEAGDRDLPATGSADDIRARLRDDDAENADEDDNPPS